MIIPPDPEKDPNLFTPADSTPSLLLPALDGDIRQPDATHPHTRQAYGYAYGEWSGEQLPPYEGKRASREGDVFSDRQEMSERRITPPRPISQPGISRPSRNSRVNGLAVLDTALPLASASTQSLPSPATTLNANASTSKLWESSSSPSKHGKRSKLKDALTPAPEIRDCWAQYRKWIVGIVITILIGLGIMTGLLVGLRVGVDNKTQDTTNSFSPWHDIDGKKANTQWAPDGSLNLTYTQNRDGPNDSEGAQSQCNQFTLVNTTDFSYLSIPYPASTLYVSTFTFPLSNSSNNDTFIQDLFITARGLGSSGTIEFIGSDYPGPIIQGGEENDIKVDVVLRYGGDQDVMDTVHVCKMDKDDGSAGIGIYSPIETDGKVTNVYMLDPTSLPSFQVVVRLPPAAVSRSIENPIWLNSLNINVDRMNIIWGDLEGVLEMGSFTFNTGRGSFNAGYLTAQKATVLSAYNDVAGTFNVSESLLVNVSDGSITAHVILHNDAESRLNDIVDNLDTSGVVFPSSSSKYDQVSSTSNASSESNAVKRSTLAIPSANATAASLDEVLLNSSVNSTPIASINTTFQTTSGSVSITYLTHPPRTALTSLVVSAEGGLNVNMHPAYVGPFAVRNVWGEVRIPQFDNFEMQDPLDVGRMRGMSLGPINVPVNSLFAEGGVNTTNLPYSGTTITGAAYWYHEINATTTTSTSYTTQTESLDGKPNSDSDPDSDSDAEQGYPQRHKDYQPGWGRIYDSAPLSSASSSLWPISPIPPVKVQSSAEGQDSQLMVLGAYGDVRVTFDGT